MTRHVAVETGHLLTRQRRRDGIVCGEASRTWLGGGVILSRAGRALTDVRQDQDWIAQRGLSSKRRIACQPSLSETTWSSADRG